MHVTAPSSSCPDLFRASTEAGKAVPVIPWTPTELVRGLKAHGSGPGHHASGED